MVPDNPFFYRQDSGPSLQDRYPFWVSCGEFAIIFPVAFKFWLVKSEPSEYSIDDLQRDRQTCWDGVRNYEARNLIRDGMSVNDRVLYYHSSTSSPAVVGVARVVSAAYPDHSALDPRSSGYDPKASRDNPRWFMVDLEFESKFPVAVTLERIRAHPKLQEMVLVRRGRLSVQPVTDHEFAVVANLGRG